MPRARTANDASPRAPAAEPQRGPSTASSVVTMRDVAAVTGVSQSTVSRVLSGAPTAVPIAPRTRERVVAAARALGYRPNPLARGLRGARTMLLGVIVREITDPFFAGAIEAVSLEASRWAYNVVLGHAHGRADEAMALWGVLEARHCDAILLLGDMSDQPRLIDDLHGTRVPVVALWAGSRPTAIPSVSVDNRAGIRLVLDHLGRLGHRRIGYVGGHRLGDIQEREDAFLEYLAETGHPVPEAYVRCAPNDPNGGAEAIGALLDLPEPPSAVVTSTDLLAIGVLYGAHERGVAVPSDLSVAGFDDIPLAAYTVPALTTVRMPVREMVATAVEMAIHGGPEDSGGWPVVLRPTLVERGSTAPAGAAG